MLKHTDLTFRRAKLFLTELEERLAGPTSPLKVEFCGEPHATENEAKKGEWAPVEKGFRYGPAYRTVWFRVSGRVPREMEGQEVGLRADVGGERTLWKGNSPVQGLDEFHAIAPLTDAAEAGAKFTLYIQAYTRNPQHRVHRREPPREQLVEQVDGAELVVVDRAMHDLYYDVAFILDLMGGIDANDPAYATLLRALNEAVNTFRFDRPETNARARKVLRDAMGTLNGELKHTVTAVGHAHLDTAWLWPIHITRKKMAHTTANQLALARKNSPRSAGNSPRMRQSNTGRRSVLGDTGGRPGTKSKIERKLRPEAVAAAQPRRSLPPVLASHPPKAGPATSPAVSAADMRPILALRWASVEVSATYACPTTTLAAANPASMRLMRMPTRLDMDA